MSLQNYNKKMLILEENGSDRKTLSEGYHYDSDTGKMRFDIKSNINGKVRETSGVLTNNDIQDIFKRIPRFNGFQLPRRMINDFLIGHESEDYSNHEASNSDVYNLLDNLSPVVSLSPKKKKKKKKKKKTIKRKHDDNKKRKRRKTIKFPKITF
jgi:hypothetical protein